MLVKELIKLLQREKQHAEVVILQADGDLWHELTSVDRNDDITDALVILD